MSSKLSMADLETNIIKLSEQLDTSGNTTLEKIVKKKLAELDKKKQQNQTPDEKNTQPEFDF